MSKISPGWLIVLVIVCIVINKGGETLSKDHGLNHDNTPNKAESEKKQPLLYDFEIMQKYGSDVKSAIPALLEGLRSKEVSIRRNAAFALGEIGPDSEAAINDLANALRNDPDTEVRRNAAFALGEIGTPSIPVLMKILSSKDSRMRRNVAAALVRIGYPAVPYLIKALQDKNPIIRRNAAGILGRIGPKAKNAIPALEKALNDDDKAFCWTVKQALRKIKQVSVENLIDCLNDKDIIIRRNAVKALGEMGVEAQSAVPALILCLNDEKAEARKNASFALAKIGEPALPALMEALKSKDVRIRRNAAFSLGEMGEKAEKAIPALRLLINDTNKKVRWCADIAIKKIKKNSGYRSPRTPRKRDRRDRQESE